MSNSYESCLAKILKVSDILQKNSDKKHSKNEGCDRPFLGTSLDNICYNTRPITLYNKCGNLFTVTNGDSTSSVFRVEQVNKNCCTLRLLKEVKKKSQKQDYIATDEFITVNLNCICALKCLKDVAVRNL